MLWIIIRAMRITPACAGRSGKRCPVATGKRDHPRVRGEKCVWFDRSHAIGGITPACAGRSGTGAFRCRAGQDHPRVCGEKRRARA